MLPNLSEKGYIKIIFILVLVVLLFLLPLFFGIYGDLLWFSSLGYSSIFVKILSWEVFLGLVFGVLYFLFVYGNIKYSIRKLRKERPEIKNKIFPFVIGFFALIVGSNLARSWEVFLKFFNSTSFQALDPVFHKNIGFYIFSLPFYSLILKFLLGSVVSALIFSALAYLYYSREEESEEELLVETKKDFSQYITLLKEKAFSHISLLLGILLILIGGWFYLQRFYFLFSGSGAVFGAGYMETNVKIPLYLLMSVASVLLGITFFLNLVKKKEKLIYYGIISLISIFILGNLYAYSIQEFVVKPDEFNKEKEFLERNIEHTLSGYKLNEIKEKKYPVSYNLTKKDIDERRGVIDNIRLWDWRPLSTTYNEMQLFRTYYEFRDIDVDRYRFNGKYRQVMLSPREMNINQLPEQTRSWVNKHLVYTHGFGVTMSPVKDVSPEGLPKFYLKDIPPKSLLQENLEENVTPLKMKRPEIYYGEATDNFVITNTKTNEFDYPKGEKNIYTTYKGKGGISLKGLNRLVFSVKTGSIQLLLSESVSDESKVLLYRKLQDRVRKIAPFLVYDRDPYSVVENGKVYWIYDAYTSSDLYPYSERVSTGSERLNYIRNSVKVVIDAYNGDVTFYVMEEEPIIKTYEKIFPDLFKGIDEMPSELRKHIRYPEDLFTIQAHLYSSYHMRDPKVFYSKEDLWKIPNEIFRGNRQKMTPYYLITQLPGEKKEEFVLLLPFVPKGRENMIGWVAARADPPNYGELITFLFPKQRLTYGPMQIESRINQNTQISQKISLWSQKGSDVIRGNLLVIPIKNSILYVEPLFLLSTQEGALPELKRVIVAYGDKLTMQPTLEEALNVIFKPGVEEVKESEKEEGKELPTYKKQLINEAVTHYDKAQKALKQGNFSLYAGEIEKLGEILESFKP